MPRHDTDLYKDSFKLMVIHAMKKNGKDFSKCEQCGTPLTEKTYRLHHTRYEGATIEDLQVVCQRCNTKKENQNLI